MKASTRSQLIQLDATAVVASLLTVFDSEFALEESAAFAKDKLRSREITWEEWKRRPMIEKVSDATVGLL